MDLVWAQLEAATASPSLVWVLIGSYLIGSIPFGYLIARTVKGSDIRQEGSGNIGATNVARVLGKKLGLLTLFLDAMKGATAVLLVRFVAEVAAEGRPTLETFAFFMALAGHCFPLWLGFRGGKGVATGIGALVVHHPAMALFAFGLFAITFSITRVVSLGSMIGVLSLPAAYFIEGLLHAQGVAGAQSAPDGRGWPYLAILALIVGKHHGNIGRLLRREESRF